MNVNQLSDNELASVIFKFHLNRGGFVPKEEGRVIAESMIRKYHIFLTDLLTHQRFCLPLVNEEYVYSLECVGIYLTRHSNSLPLNTLLDAVVEEIRLHLLDTLL